MLGCEVVNLGRHGHSNFAIMSDFVDWIEKQDTSNDAFLVCWSAMDRTTYRNSEKKHRFYGYEYQLAVERFGFVDKSNTVHDPYFTKLQSMGAYHTVKNLCKEKNIPYLMTNSVCHQGQMDKLNGLELKGYYPKDDPNWIEPQNNWNTLSDIIQEWWLKDIPKPDVNLWRQLLIQHRNKRFVREDHHPNEEGHRLIAETLSPYIKKIVEE